MDKRTAVDLLNRLCESLVLTGPDELDELAAIETGFAEVGAWATESGLSLIASAVTALRSQLQTIVEASNPRPEAALDVVNRAVAALQEIVCEGRGLEEVSFPEELGLDRKSAEGTPDEAEPKAAPEDEEKNPFPLEPQPEPAAPAPDFISALGKIDPEFVDAFITEANEHLEAIEEQVLSLQGDKLNDEAVNAIFRSFHTIKGAAAFLNLEDIGLLAHQMESLIEKARQGEVSLDDRAIDVVLRVSDALKGLVRGLRGVLLEGKPIPFRVKDTDLVARINEIAQQSDVVSSPLPAPAAAAEEAAFPGEVSSPRVRAERADTIRVDAERLDRLLDTIGELVIAESMVLQSKEIAHLGSAELDRLLRQMDKITRSLQEMSTSLRMISVRSVFLRMARLVRDLAQKANKKIDFVTRGEDTELDKAIVDKIVDPLVHLLRNAVDHGIEKTPGARRAAGKPDSARVELRAFHRGGSIYIEVEDDGLGMNRARILKRGREMGLVGPEEVLDDDAILDLIFEPGFSTAEVVTDVSGRGVGMDVVRKNIQMLRGQIQLDSREGVGTTVSIRLPLSLAIIDGMILMVGGERYIIPTLSVVRSMRPRQGVISTVLGRGEMLSVGGALIPIFRLHKLFQTQTAGVEPDAGIVVIVEDNGRQVGLVADELHGQQQIVIKGMGEYLRGTIGIAGGAIMPDGHVGLIVDVNGLATLAQAGGTRKGAGD